jgi:MFS family permease
LIASETPDARRILAARALRSFSDGYVVIAIGVFLAKLGLSTAVIGLILTATLIGAAGLTVLTAFFADRVGRKRFLLLLSALMACACLLFASASDLALLLIAALSGGLIATSLGGGAFLSLDLAILPQTAPDEHRTRVLVYYNVLSAVFGSLGSLFAGLASYLAGSNQEIIAFRALFALSGVVAFANLLLLAGLSRGVERLGPRRPASFLGVHRSRGTLLKLGGLSSIDSLAAGFAIQSIVALWFAQRWHVGLETLGPIFFSVNLLNAASYLVAERLARRIGLLRTIVLTHLPASLMMALVPFMPSLELAVLVYVGRQFLGEMDAPARQSYYMAIVDPDERVPVASLTNLARSAAGALSPVLAGYTMGALTLGIPFLCFTALKMVYLGSTFALFHQVHTPEEIARKSVGGVAR